ncbi:MAG: hypothetical protein INR64_07740 [Caulobacteraceae bacterium]|nr:hypothetical protein [Caulobacter sp.]
MGATQGHVALIIALGAMIGRLLEASAAPTGRRPT